MKSFICLILLPIFATDIGLAQAGQTGKAVAQSSCSVAHSGNYDTINIKDCGIGKEQGEKIIALLNQVLKGQAASDVDAKLDKLLDFAKRSTNPYATSVTYEPDGVVRSVNLSTGTFSTVISDAHQAALEMANLEKKEDWTALFQTCQKAIDKFPGWFTPDALIAEAQSHLCQLEEAKAGFKKFIDESDGAPAFAAMRQNAQLALQSLNEQSPSSFCSNSKK